MFEDGYIPVVIVMGEDTDEDECKEEGKAMHNRGSFVPHSSKKSNSPSFAKVIKKGRYPFLLLTRGRKSNHASCQKEDETNIFLGTQQTLDFVLFKGQRTPQWHHECTSFTLFM